MMTLKEEDNGRWFGMLSDYVSPFTLDLRAKNSDISARI
jgi:hypothetical protein